MTLTRINPPALHETPGYSHVTLIEGRRLTMLAGQCPLDATGSLVGPGDMIAQTDQVAANIAIALTAAGATADDVVRTVVYVVSSDGPALAAVWHRLRESVLGPAFGTASTLIGVTCLGFPGQLVEVDVTAAIP